MRRDAELLERFVRSAIAGRPQGFRLDDLVAATRRLAKLEDAVEEILAALDTYGESADVNELGRICRSALQ